MSRNPYLLFRTAWIAPDGGTGTSSMSAQTREEAEAEFDRRVAKEAPLIALLFGMRHSEDGLMKEVIAEWRSPVKEWTYA